MTAVIAIHALATLMMTGLIWFVQLVHYPLMARVGADGFVTYERQHMRRTTWIVAPLMLAELATAALLAFSPLPDAMRPLAWVGLLLVVLIWISTAALQVPCHRALAERYDAGVIRRLVSTNWIRTAAWSIRSVIAVTLVSSMAAGSMP